MKIILSPAKKMKVCQDTLPYVSLPVFPGQTEQILAWLRDRSAEELKTLWKCSDRIVQQNLERLAVMKLDQNLSPAILSYEGIAYQYMAPSVFESGQLDYVQEHLRILSAFYGVLKPMDGVTPYRLEMQAKASIGGYKDLYSFWGDRICQEVRDASGIIINLASREYSKCVEPYLTPEDTFITCDFMEPSGGKLVTKGTYAKMARGEMVRYLAEHSVETPEEIQAFDRLNYRFRKDLSEENRYVFVRG